MRHRNYEQVEKVRKLVQINLHGNRYSQAQKKNGGKENVDSKMHVYITCYQRKRKLLNLEK